MKIKIFLFGIFYILGQMTTTNAQFDAQRSATVIYQDNPFDQTFVPTQPAAPRSDLAEAAGAIATIFGAVAGEKAAKAERKRQRELEERYAAPMNIQQNITVDNWGSYTPPAVVSHPGCSEGEATIVQNLPYCKKEIVCGTGEKLTSADNHASCMQIFEGGGEDLKSSLNCQGSQSGLRIKDKTATCLFSAKNVS